MKIETLKQKSFNKVAIGIIASVSILSVAIFIGSYAKYRSTSSINIAKGTIKYQSPDLHLAEVYIANDTGEYELASVVPTSGYVLNEDTSKTRCENKDGSLADITITYEDGGLTFSKLINGGVKCYVYLDKKPNAADKIPEGKVTDDSMFSGISGDGVYTWIKGDYSGGDQPIKYYRGNVNNNWVVFGRDGANYIWWRIIRNNSNGSLRMIYAGTSASKTSAPATTGSGTQIGTKAFNTSYNDNMYVGFKYTNNQVHGNGINSTILGAENGADKMTLYGWYNSTIGANSDYSGKIDLDAGFCNDRGPSTSDSTLNGSGGTGTTRTYYAAYIRLVTNKAPSLLCASISDIFKTPVGLITADEVQMGGMVYSSPKNLSSYLYVSSDYWTVSPMYTRTGGDAGIFIVYSSGYLGFNSVDAVLGIRPVVNLKADTVFVSGNGEASTPFVVQDT